MTSNLAKSKIQEWWSQGLKPTVEDIILLNTLGLNVEHGPDASDFAVLPRCAYLGDLMLWEPTVRKRIWLDNAMRLLPDDDFRQKLMLIAFALNNEIDKLPPLDNQKKVIKEMSKFATEQLADFTDAQLFEAVDYALNGNEPSRDEEVKAELEESTTEGDVTEAPQKLLSIAQMVYINAVLHGIDDKTIDISTVPQLQRMIINAVVLKGADIKKNEQIQASGRFYAACGRIHKRLTEEKQKNNGEE